MDQAHLQSSCIQKLHRGDRGKHDLYNLLIWALVLQAQQLHEVPEIQPKVAQKKLETLRNGDSLPMQISQRPSQSNSISPKASTQELNHTSSGSYDIPLPLPRRMSLSKPKFRRVKALYDCTADRDDELTFYVGEIIVVTEEEDQNWWNGHIEGSPQRKGVFPASFVHILS
ncbi:arf-GAP with SH3 domain, ANK repeat and PH domain-containing protein 1-like [Microcaecilia unicolor]|uniref:Arf-GAP with SH3 domain, ANK repeat and PH domain-containing protein 1-like n=1 Tax=Microcaecilia unicolor TaxID=1415580 RepID=A0A6P7YQ16_9AMPH|nr:arf-GAP with SH3 domain, ANK repeat and PH domain-containing protein 1-like [Microcaecilia unicolor]